MSTGDAAPIPPEPVSVRPPPGGRVVTIGAVMGLIAVVAVCLSMMRGDPTIGGLALIVTITAAVRTVFQLRRRAARGMRLGPVEYFKSVGVSAFVSIAVYGGALVAFVATCVPAGLAAGVFPERPEGPGNGLVIAVGLGLIGAVVVALLILKRLWRLGD